MVLYPMIWAILSTFFSEQRVWTTLSLLRWLDGAPFKGAIQPTDRSTVGLELQSRFLGPLQLLLGWSLGVAKNGLSMAMLQWNGVSINGGTPRNKLDKIDGKWGGTHFRKPHAIYSRKLASASWSPYCFSKVLGGLESPIAWNFTLKLPPFPLLAG